MEKKQKGRGRILLQSLTADQIKVLLEVMFQELDREKVLGALKKADAEIAETVTRILDSSTDVDEHILPSDQKNIEAWNELWGRWHDIVDKVGDEHGKYAVQEDQWEPPLFDGYTVASDLEEIAEEMLTLIDRIFPLAKDPSLYVEELKLLDSHIQEYPDWMDVKSYEGCSLLKGTTRCVLLWQ